MAAWKRDFASGLIVLVPVMVTVYVVAWLYRAVRSVSPTDIVKPALLGGLDLSRANAQSAAQLISVLLTLLIFVVSVFAIGYLMRTTVGSAAESNLDAVANRLPGLRVVYNASKMAAETALGGADSLQTPVKLETWNGLRMTAFKTGKTTDDGRKVLFLPTAPNITTGFVVEVEPERIDDLDETVEDALTRILSAGFGENDRSSVSIHDVVGDESGVGDEPFDVEPDVDVDDGSSTD